MLTSEVEVIGIKFFSLCGCVFFFAIYFFRTKKAEIYPGLFNVTKYFYFSDFLVGVFLAGVFLAGDFLAGAFLDSSFLI